MAAAVLENVIAGRRVAVEGAQLQDVLDPATGDVLARVPLSPAAEALVQAIRERATTLGLIAEEEAR